MHGMEFNMKLSILLDVLNIKSQKLSNNAEQSEISGICHNSRLALPDCIFVCRKGTLVDGHMYASDAYNKGTRVFIAERELDLPDDASVIIVGDTSEALATLSCRFYSYPAREIKTVGITGTKGKTICAYSTYLILKMCGIKAGYIGTNGIYFSDTCIKSSNTTPDVLELQRVLRLMVNDGISVCIMEVSSQALWQERVKGIEFDTCVLTNLGRDHIGGYEHPTFEHYRDCKKSLFSNYGAKHIIINSDREESEYMIKNICCDDIITVSAGADKNASLYASDISSRTENRLPGIKYKCHIGEKANFKSKNTVCDIFVPFPGIFSVENSLEISAICLVLGIDISDISKYTEKITVPGRFEYLRLKSRPDSLFIIDYAHNKMSLTSTVTSLREYSPKRIICVFGSVGGRTYERRSELGSVAAQLCDISIITSDNPNFEPPEQICREIEKEFIGKGKEYYIIPDRRRAILKAYLCAGKGDYVLLAGKGHEDYQLIEGQKIHFSERETLLETDRLAQSLSDNEIEELFDSYNLRESDVIQK